MIPAVSSYDRMLPDFSYSVSAVGQTPEERSGTYSATTPATDTRTQGTEQRNGGEQQGIQRSEASTDDFRPYGSNGAITTDRSPPADAEVPGQRSDSNKDTPPLAAPQTDKQGASTGEKKEIDPQVQEAVARLKSGEEKVKAHESAHKSAGGTITGPVSYSYTRGPDGKNYITGGEVPISITPGRTPDETARRMDQVIRAALAPADPSPQDRAVAAQAATAAQKARMEKASSETSTTSASAPTDVTAENGIKPSGDSEPAAEGYNSAASSNDVQGSGNRRMDYAAISAGTTSTSSTTTGTMTPAAEDARIGSVARLSRLAYSDPSVTGTSDRTREFSGISLMVPGTFTPSSSAPEMPGRTAMAVVPLSPDMITGFASSPISLYA